MNKDIVDYPKLIKEKIKIVDIISRDVKLVKSGDNYKGLCPFHNEKTPSFVVNNNKDSFNCFGCGISGDIFTYVMEKNKLEFKEALIMLASETNVNLNYSNKKGQKKYNSIKEYFEIMNLIENFYHQSLQKLLSNKSLPFLSNKKINLKEVENFKIGLSTTSKDLELYLLEKGIQSELLVEFGIFKVNKYGKNYDLFNNRLIFPIKDKLNRTLGFGGRKLDNSEGPKYINSWENDFFKKRHILYNMDCLTRIKNKSEALYIVEGYTDVIALNKVGLNAVAPLGTSISLEQISLTWNYVNDPILFLDGDNAGIKASSRVLDMVLPELGPGRSVNFIFLDSKEDPDNIINGDNGIDRINSVLAKKNTLFEALILLEDTNELNSPERLLEYKKRIADKINLIKDMETKSLYKLFAKKRFNSLFDNRVSHQANFSSNTQKDKYFAQTTRKRNSGHFVLRRERAILSVMLNNFRLLINHDEVLAKIYISDEGLSELRDEIIEIISTDKVKSSYELKALLVKKKYSNIIKKHFFTTDCIHFNLIDNYAKESAEIEYATKALMDIISIQETWYKNKNKMLPNNHLDI